jgi:MYXO-CTERM domain-containing protein
MRKLLAPMTLALLLLFGLGTVATAQTNQDTGAGYGDTNRDNDHDWGWVGLLGLGGLLGLRRREVPRDMRSTTTTTAPTR